MHRAIDWRFALDDDNTPIVADICRRLDGIPLAIEFAAPRVAILRPHELQVRLDERFRLLTRGSRETVPRHQTLRALIDWSYDLLNERERRLFRRLGTFVNGITLQGAIVLACDESSGELDVMELLASLVDKSLIIVDRDAERTRYRLLESTRSYAIEKRATMPTNASYVWIGIYATSDDVFISTTLVLDPRTNEISRAGYEDIVRVAAPDKFTVVVRLRRPLATVRF